MSRVIIMLRTLSLVAATTAVLFVGWPALSAQSGGYEVVPDWPTLPEGWVLGLPGGVPSAAMRDTLPDPQTPREQAQRTEYARWAGVAVDSRDRVYVYHRPSTFRQFPIAVFDRDGNYLQSGGEVVPFQLNMPHYVSVDDEFNLFIMDTQNHRILKLNPAMDKVVMEMGTKGEPGGGATHFNRPADITFTSSGDLLVADGYGGTRVARFTKDGEFISEFGSPGTGPGEFNVVHCIEVDAEDNIYVLDRENLRVQIFDSEGTYLREWGGFEYPWGLALSPDGFAFVADKGREEIIKLRMSDGEWVERFGGPGRGPGEFDWAHAVSLDSTGAVYVFDTYGQRVQKFVKTGE